MTEDLSIELLAHFSDEDLPHLEKTISKLQTAADILMQCDLEVPYATDQLLRNYREASKAGLN